MGAKTGVGVALLQLLLLAGCGASSDAEDEDELDFHYERSCFFGCAMQQPLLIGTRESVGVEGPGDAAGVTPRSSDEAVARFSLERDCRCEADGARSYEIDLEAGCNSGFQKVCDNHFPVDAVGLGDADLELVGASGNIVASTTVRVREAAKLELVGQIDGSLDTTNGYEHELSSGQTLLLEGELFDSDGVKMLAPEGVTWTSQDPSVATVSIWLVGSGQSVTAGLSASVVAEGPGETQVSLAIAGIDPQVTVRVAE